jgi:hypothetical protein
MQTAHLDALAGGTQLLLLLLRVYQVDSHRLPLDALMALTRLRHLDVSYGGAAARRRGAAAACRAGAVSGSAAAGGCCVVCACRIETPTLEHRPAANKPGTPACCVCMRLAGIFADQRPALIEGAGIAALARLTFLSGAGLASPLLPTPALTALHTFKAAGAQTLALRCSCTVCVRPFTPCTADTNTQTHKHTRMHATQASAGACQSQRCRPLAAAAARCRSCR